MKIFLSMVELLFIVDDYVDRATYYFEKDLLINKKMTN